MLWGAAALSIKAAVQVLKCIRLLQVSSDARLCSGFFKTQKLCPEPAQPDWNQCEQSTLRQQDASRTAVYQLPCSPECLNGHQSKEKVSNEIHNNKSSFVNFYTELLQLMQSSLEENLDAKLGGMHRRTLLSSKGTSTGWSGVLIGTSCISRKKCKSCIWGGTDQV